MTEVRFVYELVGGKADGQYVVTGHRVNTWKVPMVQLLPGFFDMLAMVPPSPPETYQYVVSRQAGEITLSAEAIEALGRETEAFCIERARRGAGVIGEMRLA